MKIIKQVVRVTSKVVGVIAVMVFLFAPFTNAGLAFMAGSVVVGLICFAGYMWSDPD